MNQFQKTISSEDYFTEAVYKDNSNLKKIEKEFEAIIKETNAFYDGMRQNRLNPSDPSHIIAYYYSKTPERDGTRITQYNNHLKTIEDLVKKTFHFRDVRVEFQLFSIIGAHTIPAHKTMFYIPVMFRDKKVRVMELDDIGTTKDGQKWKIGYPTTIEASIDGIIDTNNAINVNIKLQMYKDVTAREYVAIMLHEIGHNLDITFIDIEVKNDKKMIKVMDTVAKRPSSKPLPNAIQVLFDVAKRRIVDKEDYESSMSDILVKLAKKVQYGGKHQRGELLADMLPTAFGYGPDLIRALNKLSPDVSSKYNKSLEIKHIFQVMSTYNQAIEILGKLSDREGSVHGSNVHRMGVILKQLEDDLKRTKDSKLRARIIANMNDLKKIHEEMLNDPEKSNILSNLFRAWVEHIKV
jgi:hypothetical protein